MIFILPFLAILIGFFLGKLLAGKISWAKHLLAFSGAFLLSITVFEMLPEVFQAGNDHVGTAIMVGILLQILLEYFSKGAEHGHVHLNTQKQQFPWILLISLSVHAFIEGFPITSSKHVLWGVILHKIPIAIILSLYFIKANFRTLHTIFFLVLFGMMTPLGSFLATHASIVQQQLEFVNAMAIGVFLHVSTTILFESSKDHRFNIAKLAIILLGVVSAYFL